MTLPLGTLLLPALHLGHLAWSMLHEGCDHCFTVLRPLQPLSLGVSADLVLG